MTLADQILSDMAVFINTGEFAEAVTYTPSGGTGSSVSAVVVRGEYTKDFIGSELYLIKRANVTIAAADLSAVPNPDGDIMTLDGSTWDVESYNPVGHNAAYKIAVITKTLLSREAY